MSWFFSRRKSSDRVSLTVRTSSAVAQQKGGKRAEPSCPLVDAQAALRRSLRAVMAAVIFCQPPGMIKMKPVGTKLPTSGAVFFTHISLVFRPFHLNISGVLGQLSRSSAHLILQSLKLRSDGVALKLLERLLVRVCASLYIYVRGDLQGKKKRKKKRPLFNQFNLVCCH